MLVFVELSVRVSAAGKCNQASHLSVASGRLDGRGANSARRGLLDN